MGKYDALMEDAPAPSVPPAGAGKYAALFDGGPTGASGGTGRPVESGNIDMSTRPHVKNADGTTSTVRSMSFSERKGGPEILIPTVPDEGGRLMSDNEAIDRYYQTGRHLGKFASVPDADAFAAALHDSEAAKGNQPYGHDPRSLPHGGPRAEAKDDTPSGPRYKPVTQIDPMLQGPSLPVPYVRAAPTDPSESFDIMAPGAGGIVAADQINTGLRALAGGLAGGAVAGTAAKAVPALRGALAGGGLAKLAALGAEGAATGAGATAGGTLAGEGRLPTAEEAGIGAAAGGTLGLGLPLAARAAEKTLQGAVARSAAREAGAVLKAAKDTIRGVASHGEKRVLYEVAAHQLGLPPGVVTGVKMLPGAARTTALAADEGVAAIGRAAGIKPYSPVNYTQPPPAAVLPEAVPVAIGEEPTAALTSPNAMPEVTPNVSRETGYQAPGGVPTSTSENATVKVTAPEGFPGWSRNPEPGTAYEGPPPPGDANVKPPAEAKEMSPKMQAYRERLKNAEDEKFAKSMGLPVDKYRELLARRAARTPAVPSALEVKLSELVAQSRAEGWSKKKLAKEVASLRGEP